jgi:hypothetical protein
MDRWVKILVVVLVLCGVLLSNAAAMAHGTLSAASSSNGASAHFGPVADAGQERELNALPDYCLEQSAEHHSDSLHDRSCCFNVCLDPAWLAAGEVQSWAPRNAPFTIMNYKLLADALSPPRRPPRSRI